MQSLNKKIKSIIKNGLDPIEDGINNFNHPTQEVEQIAKERAEVCAGCPLMETEPISFLKVKDKTIIGISEMMCGECGCTLPYKVRQNQTICPKWNK